MRFKFLFFTLLLLAVFFANSPAPNYPPFPKVITENGMICYYVDLPHGDSPGHGFIKIKMSDGTWRGYGFYPSGDGTLSPVFDTGIIKDDGERTWDWKLCFNATAKQLSSAFATIKKWDNSSYFVLGENCVEFLTYISDATNLHIDPMTFPLPNDLSRNLQRNGGVKNNETDKSKDYDPQTGEPIEPGKNLITAGIKRNVDEEESEDEIPQEDEVPESNSCNPNSQTAPLNEKIGMLPSVMQNELKDQQINVELKTNAGEVHRVALIFEGTKLTQITQPVKNPTLEIKTNYETLYDISSLNDPDRSIKAARSAIASGEIAITSTNNPTGLYLFGLLNRFELLFNPPKDLLAIRVGEAKPITYNGVQSVLSMTNTNIRLVTPENSRESIVVNQYGTAKGYTPVYGYLIISQSNSVDSFVTTKQIDTREGAVELSRNAGIYINSINSISGWSSSLTNDAIVDASDYFSYRVPSGGTLYNIQNLKTSMRGAGSVSRATPVYTGAALGSVYAGNTYVAVR